MKNLLHTIDSTDVAANVNYLSEKKLIKKSFTNVIKELEKYKDGLAKKS